MTAVEIPLTNGGVALVDAADAPRVRTRRWRRSTWGYAVSTIPKTQRVVWMHRWILDAPPDKDVDHRNRIRLDNQRTNLRVASRAQNLANGAMHRDNRAGVKGVTVLKETGRFLARIAIGGRTQHLGRFDTAAEAGAAYTAAAQRLAGPFARGNA